VFCSFSTGTGSLIAEEGAAIYEVVKDKLDESRAEFSHLEEAVEEQMSTKPKKRRKKSAGKASSPASSAANMGMAEYLGGLPDNFNIEDLGSDSDDSLLLDL
jgi:hypothetical protein